MANKRILGIAIVTGALWLPTGPASLATPASHGASVIPNAAHSIDVLDEVAARGGGGGGGGGGARGGGPRGGGGMIGGGGRQVGGGGGGGGQAFATAGGGMAGMAAGMTGGTGKQVAGKGAKGKQAAGTGGMGKQTAGKGGKGKQATGKGGKAGGMGKDIAKKGGGAGGTVGVGPGNRPVRPWIQRPYYGTIIGGVALGALLAATAYGVIPTAPADGLCWFWADDNLVQGYWDYC